MTGFDIFYYFDESQSVIALIPPLTKLFVRQRDKASET